MKILDKEKETLLIPLYGKAMESRKETSFFYDRKAIEIVDNIEYDFRSLKIPGKTNEMMCLRAKLFDNFVAEYVSRRKNCTVLHLGCGLDSRYLRISSASTSWYDVDFPEVIAIRKNFYSETDRYHMIASSVTDEAWIKTLPAVQEDHLVIAEGLLMYLKEDEIKKLLEALKKRIGGYTLIFDAFSSYTAKRLKEHPSIKRTGAAIYWGIDDPEELTSWDPGIRLIRKIVFTANEVLGTMRPLTRWAYRLANLFPVARNAHRILVYTIV